MSTANTGNYIKHRQNNNAALAMAKIKIESGTSKVNTV